MDSLPEHWSIADVGSHSCEVYEPPQASEHGFVVVYLHGVHINHLYELDGVMTQLARHGLRAVCPRTGRSWWTDKICAEFDPAISAERYVIEHVMPFVRERFGAAPPRVALLGTSMGGQGALRLGFKHPQVFPVVVAVSPAIDYQQRFEQDDQTLPQMYPHAEAARQDTATLHVHPLNWVRNLWFCCDPTDLDWYESSERLRMKLSALGVPHECDLATSGGGHGAEYYNHMAPAAIGFIAERLERERLRVI